jgi:hypothetical protein
VGEFKNAKMHADVAAVTLFCSLFTMLVISKVRGKIAQKVQQGTKISLKMYISKNPDLSSR